MTLVAPNNNSVSVWMLVVNITRPSALHNSKCFSVILSSGLSQLVKFLPQLVAAWSATLLKPMTTYRSLLNSTKTGTIFFASYKTCCDNNRHPLFCVLGGWRCWVSGTLQLCREETRDSWNYKQSYYQRKESHREDHCSGLVPVITAAYIIAHKCVLWFSHNPSYKMWSVKTICNN